MMDRQNDEPTNVAASYCLKLSEAQSLINEIQAYLDDYGYVGPSIVNESHVEEAERIVDHLKDVADVINEAIA